MENNLQTPDSIRKIFENNKMKVFVQVRMPDQRGDWDSIEVRVCDCWESTEEAAKWAQQAAIVLKAKIRMTYPSFTWKPSHDMSVQEYAGRLSGAYFERTGV